jgi:hypothetical protein
LQEISRRKPILKNRRPVEIEQAVVALAIEQPAWGQVRISEGAEAARPVDLAGRGALRLAAPQSHFDETPPQGARNKVAQDGLLLTEAQIAALEKAKADNEAHGEFDSECPGYCGAQDTFYVGTLKGVGRRLAVIQFGERDLGIVSMTLC